jgi:hypothetical protein
VEEVPQGGNSCASDFKDSTARYGRWTIALRDFDPAYAPVWGQKAAEMTGRMRRPMSASLPKADK